MRYSPKILLALSFLATPTITSGFVAPRPNSRIPVASPSASALDATRLVWLTGYEDMRIRDHGGFQAALEEAGEDDLVLPVFILDPKVHLRCQSASALKRLHASLTEMEAQLESLSESIPNLAPLVVKTGLSSWAIPALADEIGGVSACHVVVDDVVDSRRSVQKAACQTLRDMGIQVERWDPSLRPAAPWAAQKGNLPSFFPDYCQVADSLNPPKPNSLGLLEQFEGKNKHTKAAFNIPQSDGIPILENMMEMAVEETPSAVNEARTTICTMEPYDHLVTEWSTESGSQKALDEYSLIGKDAFADRHLIASDAANKGVSPTSIGKSLYASSAARLVRSRSHSVSEALALREAPTRAFSSALALGSLSARDVLDAARNRASGTPPVLWFDAPKVKNDGNNRAGVLPSDDPWWGRSSEGSLADVVEWREWFRLLAERSLELQEAGDSGATSGGEKEMSGDARETGTVRYWRWKGQHLVRYMSWPAGKDYDEDVDGPAMLMVHGFAASVEQWERLVHAVRKETVDQRDGKDKTPPIFAVDLLGFGHSEKPGLSYTQYLWESQIVDFAVEVMEATPMVMVGNSIGGGLSAGAAAILGPKICRGLVLCNTAGILEDPANYRGYPKLEEDKATFSSYTEAAMEGNPNEAPYSTVPLFGNKVLDLFGRGVIQSIYPEIEKRLSLIYQNRMQNADPAVAYAIQQAAKGPGSANVVGSGQKLAPNRPLNEVLVGVPTLVVMGLDDQVSSPMVAQTRAELFSRLYPDAVKVNAIAEAGHCPHDDVPDEVAAAIVGWQMETFGRENPVTEGENLVEDSIAEVS